MYAPCKVLTAPCLACVLLHFSVRIGRCNTAAGLRFSLVTYYLYASVGKAARFLNCSHLHRFTDCVYALQYCVAAPCLFGHVRLCTLPVRYSRRLVLLAPCTVFADCVYTSHFIVALWQLSVTYYLYVPCKFSAPFLNCSHLRRLISVCHTERSRAYLKYKSLPQFSICGTQQLSARSNYVY